MYRYILKVCTCFACIVLLSSPVAFAADDAAKSSSQTPSSRTEQKRPQPLSTEARQLYYKAMSLANSGESDKALKTYDQAIALAPDDHMLSFKKGHLLLRMKKYAEAAQAFDEAIAKGSHMASAWHFKGYALLYNGDYEEAIEAFDIAIEKLPNSPAARQGRAEAKKKLEDSKS